MGNKKSPEVAIEELKELLREKEELRDVIAEKIEKLVEELEGRHPHPHDPALHRIITGFTHFKFNVFDKNPDLFDELAERQNPKYLVFACSDSRVSPTMILNLQPGEAFMVRNIANMVPPFDQVRHTGVGAVLEYGIATLEIPNIVVIGHSKCGGIKRLMNKPEDGSDSNDFIDEWMKTGLAAKAKVLREHPHENIDVKCQLCEKESVNNSLVNLQSYPYVRAGIKNNKLSLLGGYYDFVKGKFLLWKYNSHVTHPIVIPTGPGPVIPDPVFPIIPAPPEPLHPTS